MGFSRQEYWSGLPFPSPGNLPNPGIKPGSPEFQADALTSEPLTNATTWMNLKHTTVLSVMQFLALIPFTQSSGTGRTARG